MQGESVQGAGGQMLEGFISKEDAFARALVARDARWAADAMISLHKSVGQNPHLLLLLIGQSSRVVYEGIDLIRRRPSILSATAPADDFPSLDDEVTTRARHAGKFLDDDRRSYKEIGDWLIAHHKDQQGKFLGNAKWFARFLERDLSLLVVRDRLLGASIPLQARIGVPPGLSFEEVAEVLTDVANKQGNTLRALANIDGEGLGPLGTIDYTDLRDLRTLDRKSQEYLQHRYAVTFDDRKKLLLLMIECELATTDLLLRPAEGAHTEAVFRARLVSVYHALRSLANPQLAASGYSPSLGLAVDKAARSNLMRGRIAKTLRNHCMHYELRFPNEGIGLTTPIRDLASRLYPRRTFGDIDEELQQMAHQLSISLAAWTQRGGQGA